MTATKKTLSPKAVKLRRTIDDILTRASELVDLCNSARSHSRAAFLEVFGDEWDGVQAKTDLITDASNLWRMHGILEQRLPYGETGQAKADSRA